MVLGYRLALAGGQEYFGITPDLTTFGKGMANGAPIGMLCGKREYMQHAELISGTFGGNAFSLAAATRVLDVYEDEPVIDTMWKRGQEFQDYFNGEASNLNVEAECIGYPCKPKINFKYSNVLNEKSMSLFLQETAAHGMLWHPGGGNVCYALTDRDMEVTKHAITKGLSSVRHAVWNNDWSGLKGNIIKPVITVRQ
jgi:glutamate-1-semialdehyde aminotransferase